jgi:hypothetical protein
LDNQGGNANYVVWRGMRNEIERLEEEPGEKWEGTHCLEDRSKKVKL